MSEQTEETGRRQKTCDQPMCPVAGGGFLYCNEPEGHKGRHAHTLEQMVPVPPVAAGSPSGSSAEEFWKSKYPKMVDEAGVCEFAEAYAASERALREAAEKRVADLQAELERKNKALTDLQFAGRVEYSHHRRYGQGGTNEEPYPLRMIVSLGAWKDFCDALAGDATPQEKGKF